MVFKKGESGNPSGENAAKKREQIKDKLLPHVDSAVRALVRGLKDEDKYLVAAKEILDRLYGKAPQSHDFGEGADNIINAILRVGSKENGS